jgi:serine/threonine protein kinase
MPSSTTMISAMLQYRPPHHILLYVFLVAAFLGMTTRNHEILITLKSMERSPYLQHSEGCISNSSKNNNNNRDHTFLAHSDQAETKRFREELELVKLFGKGYVSYAFEAKYQNKTVIAKITSDKFLFYSDLEIGIFEELNAPPTIPNIPQLQMAIRSMPNPFANHLADVNKTISFLKKDLGLSRSEAEDLLMKRRISVMVMDLLENHRKPKNLEEIQRLAKSMLETMNFVHSRNIMHCDLHFNNFHWDGERFSLYDWNGGFRYEPDTVMIHYPLMPTHLFPPEAKHNHSAVHTSVYAYDVYTMGRLLKMALKSCCGITFDMLKEAALANLDGVEDRDDVEAESREISHSSGGDSIRRILQDTDSPSKDDGWEDVEYDQLDAALAYELAAYMMIPDPYKRPDTAKALQHPFFDRDIPKPKRHKTE